MAQAGVVMFEQRPLRGIEARVPTACKHSTPHLPKQSSSGSLGKSFFPPFANEFLPIAHLNTSLRSQSPVAIMHAQLLPRKPRALKQELAGLMLSSFFIKQGEWALWRMITVN